MKIKNIILLILLSLIIIVGFAGCSLFGTKIDERIDSFISDLNNDRANAYNNFHPDKTTDYSVIKPATYWDTDFPSGTPDYSISGLDDSDSDNVTATIDGAADTGFGGPKPIKFKMAKDGYDWMIEELTLDGTLIVD